MIKYIIKIYNNGGVLDTRWDNLKLFVVIHDKDTLTLGEVVMIDFLGKYLMYKVITTTSSYLEVSSIYGAYFDKDKDINLFNNFKDAVNKFKVTVL